MAHHGLLVVGRQVLVSGDGRHGGEAGQVVLAATGLRGEAWTVDTATLQSIDKGKLRNKLLCSGVLPTRGVWVVRLGNLSKQLDVVVAQWRGGAHAAARAAAGEGVGRAGGHLLRGQRHQLPAGDSRVRLDLLSRSERLRGQT